MWYSNGMLLCDHYIVHSSICGIEYLQISDWDEQREAGSFPGKI